MERIRRRLFQKVNNNDLVYAGGIALCGIASLLAWWIGFVNPISLMKLYLVVHLDDQYLHANGAPAIIRIILSFVILGLSYWFAFRWAGRTRSKLAWGVLAVSVVLQSIMLLYMAPFNSNDIFDNISHGRILGIYHENPFKYLPIYYPHDPFTAYDGWSKSPSAYGPLWEVLAGITARIAGNGIVENILAFKIVPGIFLLGSSALIALILKSWAPRRALSGTLLLAWNPVVLFEVWGNGHNDPVFVFWVILAVWALRNRYYSISILSLVAGALVKYIPVLFLPAAGLIALQALPDLRERLSFLLRTGAASVGMVIFAYAPFWIGPDTLTLDRRMHLFATSISSMLYYSLGAVDGFDRIARMISPLASIITVLFALWMGYRAMHSYARDRFAYSAIVILEVYLLGTILWYWPWYSIWVIGLAPLVEEKKVRDLAIVIGFATLTKNIIFRPILNYVVPPIPQPSLEIYQTIGVMAIPWIFGLYILLSHAWRSRRVTRRAVFTAEAGDD